MYNKNRPCGCERRSCDPCRQDCRSRREEPEYCCQEDYGFDWGAPVPQPEQRQPGCRWPCGCNPCRPCPDPEPCPEPQPTECETQLAECREELRSCRRRLRACQQELCACRHGGCCCRKCHTEQPEDPQPVQNEQDSYPMCEE